MYNRLKALPKAEGQDEAQRSNVIIYYLLAGAGVSCAL